MQTLNASATANVLLVVLLVFNLTQYTQAESRDNAGITVVVADFPPYVSEQGQAGFFVDVLKELAQRSGLAITIQHYPWGRAQLLAAGHSELVIAPLTRTDEREPHYQWIIPVLSDPYYLYRLRHPGNAATPLSDGMIVVQRDSPGEYFLRNSGFANLQAVTSEQLAAAMLLRQRVDYWFVRELVARQLITEEGGNPDELEAVMGHITAPMYLGAGLSLPSATVERLREAFTSLQDDGTYDRLLEYYR